VRQWLAGVCGVLVAAHRGAGDARWMARSSAGAYFGVRGAPPGVANGLGTSMAATPPATMLAPTLGDCVVSAPSKRPNRVFCAVPDGLPNRPLTIFNSLAMVAMSFSAVTCGPALPNMTALPCGVSVAH